MPLLRYLMLAVLGVGPLAVSLGAQSSPGRPSAPAPVPGIPDRPELVTTVPFALNPTGTIDEQTKILIPADAGGWHGLFTLDLGAPTLALNRTVVRPRPTDGIDTVRATDTADPHRLRGSDQAHVVLRIGTLTIDPVDPSMPSHMNAALDHEWNSYTQDDGVSRLGNIGLSVLEPFETIIDYMHGRVVLIRLDSAGHRLVDVPAYTPTWSAPLIDIPFGSWQWWGVEARVGGAGGVVDSLFFDTGCESNEFLPSTVRRVTAHLSKKRASWLAPGLLRDSLDKRTLDSLVIGGRSFTAVPLGFGYHPPVSVLGFLFFKSLGAVGFNHRTHQFILYR